MVNGNRAAEDWGSNTQMQFIAAANMRPGALIPRKHAAVYNMLYAARSLSSDIQFAYLEYLLTDNWDHFVTAEPVELYMDTYTRVRFWAWCKHGNI